MNEMWVQEECFEGDRMMLAQETIDPNKTKHLSIHN